MSEIHFKDGSKASDAGDAAALYAKLYHEERQKREQLERELAAMTMARDRLLTQVADMVESATSQREQRSEWPFPGESAHWRERALKAEAQMAVFSATAPQFEAVGFFALEGRWVEVEDRRASDENVEMFYRPVDRRNDG